MISKKVFKPVLAGSLSILMLVSASCSTVRLSYAKIRSL